MEEQAKNMKIVWAVVERTQSGSAAKSFWTRVGVGFVNRDGSLTLRLDAIPLSGRLQVREWEPMDRQADSNESQSRSRTRPPTGPAGDALI
jgi:hypothetical protein